MQVQNFWKVFPETSGSCWQEVVVEQGKRMAEAEHIQSDGVSREMQCLKLLSEALGCWWHFLWWDAPGPDWQIGPGLGTWASTRSSVGQCRWLQRTLWLCIYWCCKTAPRHADNISRLFTHKHVITLYHRTEVLNLYQARDPATGRKGSGTPWYTLFKI